MKFCDSHLQTSPDVVSESMTICRRGYWLARFCREAAWEDGEGSSRSEAPQRVPVLGSLGAMGAALRIRQSASVGRTGR
jgi:hypothetical protein